MPIFGREERKDDRRLWLQLLRYRIIISETRNDGTRFFGSMGYNFSLGFVIHFCCKGYG